MENYERKLILDRIDNINSDLRKRPSELGSMFCKTTFATKGELQQQKRKLLGLLRR